VVVATHDEIFKALDVLGWTKQEFGRALQSLIEEGAARETPLQGVKQPLLVVGSD
jgi:hypothetical protein